MNYEILIAFSGTSGHYYGLALVECFFLMPNQTFILLG